MGAGTWAVIALAVVGTGLELCGIVVVALDIRKDLRAVRELLESDAGRFPVGTSVEIRYKIEGREPTTQERLERVEKQVQDLVGVEGRLRSEYQGEIAMRVGAVVRWLNEQLSGGIGRRWWGVGLFGAGAFLSGLANVFGALS